MAPFRRLSCKPDARGAVAARGLLSPPRAGRRENDPDETTGDDTVGARTDDGRDTTGAETTGDETLGARTDDGRDTTGAETTGAETFASRRSGDDTVGRRRPVDAGRAAALAAAPVSRGVNSDGVDRLTAGRASPRSTDAPSGAAFDGVAGCGR